MTFWPDKSFANSVVRRGVGNLVYRPLTPEEVEKVKRKQAKNSQRLMVWSAGEDLTQPLPDCTTRRASYTTCAQTCFDLN